MPQLFHHSTNTIARVSMFGSAFFLVSFIVIITMLDRGGYWTGQSEILEQPVPFSHKHHIVDVGIDCRYCHTSVENSSFAGVPPTETCMNCHSQIWDDSPMLEPVRASFRDNEPLLWSRVHDLPDFVYFDHSVHLAKGIGCVSCHGRVDKMPLMLKANTLQMKWCLECHRNPEKFVRPRSEVFNMDWDEPDDVQALRGRLAQAYHLQSMTNCTTCHR